MSQEEKITIAVDAAGGDYAPHEVVKGAVKAAQDFGVEVALVGRNTVLNVMAGKSLTKPGITIVNASQVIKPGESPLRAVQSKPDSSIVVGINLLKSGRAHAFISAGSTGAVFAAALLVLGKSAGIDRPAIGCFLDTLTSYPSLLVDAGANSDCRPSHLLQFARMGVEYSSRLLGISSPRVALLSNGTEEHKGSKLVQESYQLLKSAEDLNFIGNMEGQDLQRRVADVIVTDGFTGNVVIKTIEGLSDGFLSSARHIGHVFTSVSHLRGRTLLHDIGLGSWVKKMDYTEYGGACLLGINGNVIIAHGRSQAKAIRSAIALARETVVRRALQHTTGGRDEQNNNG